MFGRPGITWTTEPRVAGVLRIVRFHAEVSDAVSRQAITLVASLSAPCETLPGPAKTFASPGAKWR
jgi:hypothetical protein